ncbi:MAG: FHA domain-containing protein [Lachnospiraceae bacterium]|nr:FHA domain-containing protein [Lachnospiraceae bacterium]
MEVRYRRELNETYMILGEEVPCEEFAREILRANRLEGLMPLSVRETNGVSQYYFRIEQGNSLARMLSRRPVTFTEIRQLLLRLSRTLEGMERYLLEADHLILDPEMIYAGQDLSQAVFCCHPAFRRDFFRQLGDLMQYFLNKLDHSNPGEMEAAYELFEISRQECFRFEDMLEVLGRERWGREAPVPESAEEERREERLWEPLPEEEGEDAEEEVREGRFLVLLPVFLLPGLLLAALALRQWRGQGAADGRYLVGSGLFLAAGIVYAVRFALSRKNRQDTLKPERETGGFSDFLKGEKEEESRIYDFPRGEKEEESRLPGCAAERKGNEEDPGWDAETTILGAARYLPSGGWTFVSENSLRYESFRVNRIPFVIGKEAGISNGICENSFISRKHARVERQGEEFFLMDCTSTNGTWLNGRRLEPEMRYPLKEGDEVMFADQKYIFEADGCSVDVG